MPYIHRIGKCEYNDVMNFDEPQIPHTIRTSTRAKRLSISVRQTGEVALIVPVGSSIRTAEKFLKKKMKWVMKKLDFFKKMKVRHPELKVLKSQNKKAEVEAARVLVKNLIQKHNEQDRFRYNRISIKNHRSRWGSCSSKRNLNFNAKIALLPSHLAEYIVVHELCHLKEMNHSRRFWQRVEGKYPQYKNARKELKSYSSS